MSRNQGQRVHVPDDLREVLLEFTITYLLEQPGDVINYAAEYFTRLRDARQTDVIYEGKTMGSPSSPEESIIGEEGNSGVFHLFRVIILFLTLCR